MRYALASEAVAGRSDAKPPTVDFLAGEGNTESDALHGHTQRHDGLTVQEHQGLAGIL